MLLLYLCCNYTCYEEKCEGARFGHGKLFCFEFSQCHLLREFSLHANAKNLFFHELKTNTSLINFIGLPNFAKTYENLLLHLTTSSLKTIDKNN
jgi:hypothetical protein